MKLILAFLLTILLLSACAGSPATPTDKPPSPDDPVSSDDPNMGAPVAPAYLPQPGDSSLMRGNVFIEYSELLIMESYPVQIMLVLKGELPTPCNQLRVATNPPNEQNQIHVEVYSVLPPEKMCAQVLEPFETNVGLGSFPSGHYSVWVNAEMVGEFDT